MTEEELREMWAELADEWFKRQIERIKNGTSQSKTKEQERQEFEAVLKEPIKKAEPKKYYAKRKFEKRKKLEKKAANILSSHNPKKRKKLRRELEYGFKMAMQKD